MNRATRRKLTKKGVGCAGCGRPVHFRSMVRFNDGVAHKGCRDRIRASQTEQAKARRLVDSAQHVRDMGLWLPS